MGARLQGQGVRAEEGELLRQRQLRVRHPGAYRSGHQVRPQHWYLRHGLLRCPGKARHERASQAEEDWSRRLSPPPHQGGRPEVVPAEVRRSHPVRQEAALRAPTRTRVLPSTICASAHAAINNLCKRARARTTANNLLVLCLTRFNILQKRKHFPKKKKNLFPPKKKKKKKKKK